MKAYWINTPNKTVEEIEYDDDYKSISKDWLKCDYFTVVRIDGGDVVYVDDEGLINGNEHGWFQLLTYHQALKGYGLVLGTDNEGNSVAPKISLDDLRLLVNFPAHIDESSIDKSIRVTSF